MRRALITGITGQDGSYLAEALLERGYEVHGLVRRPDAPAERIAQVRDRLTLHSGDLLDPQSLEDALAASRADEVYNLAAASSVAASWEDPAGTGETTGLGAARLLEAWRRVRPEARLFHASSNQIFSAGGSVDEATPVAPLSPYGAAKAYAHHLVRAYREAYGLFCASGILFNHESPRRGDQFVTRKISSGVAAIKLGRAEELRLGALEAQRDWGYAPDYVDAMWRMLQRDEPADYVLASGRAASIQEVVALAFAHVGLDWREHVRVDDAFKRPAETDPMVGDASKARRELGWQATTGLETIIGTMVDADLERLANVGPA